MLTKLQARRNAKGFTLIELLVTIVIIGILAAVAMLAYNHQTAKADRSAGIQDLTLAAQSAESFGTDNAGSFASLDTNALASNGYKAGKVTTVKADANDYCLAEVTPKGVALQYDSNDGKATDGDCSAAAGSVAAASYSWFQVQNGGAASFPGGRTASIAVSSYSSDGSAVYFDVTTSDSGDWAYEIEQPDGTWTKTYTSNGDVIGLPQVWAGNMKTPVAQIRLVDTAEGGSDANAVVVATITAPAN